MTAAWAEDPPADDAAARGAGPAGSAQPQARVVVTRMPRTAKVIRIGVMAQELLEEVRRAPLDQAGRARLRDAVAASVSELAGCLPPHLAAELRQFTPALTGRVPSQAELRVAQAQLAGWLEGLLRSIQATMDAQQATALRKLVERSARGGQPDRPAPARADRSEAYR